MTSPTWSWLAPVSAPGHSDTPHQDLESCPTVNMILGVQVRPGILYFYQLPGSAAGLGTIVCDVIFETMSSDC